LGRAGDAGACAHYEDPSYYTKTYAKRKTDVDYYVALARGVPGPVLEYGIGNGRVALALARAGVEVFGVDLSRAMLRDLERRLTLEPAALHRRVRARRGDMRSVRLGRRFGLVIAPFNVILHLYTRRDVERFFARVREHLAPNGRFVFDFSLPQAADLCRDPARHFGAPRIRHPRTGELCRYRERFEYDPIRQLLLVEMEFSPVDGGKPWTVPLTHRQFFPQEMAALLAHSGFARVRLSADFSDEPPGPDTDSLVVEALAGAERRV
jgi:SAM-dependent methyltransferase